LSPLEAHDDDRDSRDESIDERLNETSYPPASETRWRQPIIVLLVLSIAVNFILTGTLAYKAGTSPCPTAAPGAKIPYSPAPMKWISKKLDPDPRFMGQPRLEMDQAWYEILKGTMIHFSDEELLLANQSTSVKFADGPGYVGGLAVSHSLHCLKGMKQYLHLDYYYSYKEQDWDELYAYVDHCLESIRQYIVCKADVNVFTLVWTAHSRIKPSTHMPQQPACVDQEALQEWMMGRAVRADQMVGPPASLYEHG
ncbi:hypothetical protein B0H63DRAFT_542867, partial [Podospora didyma]